MRRRYWPDLPGQPLRSNELTILWQHIWRQQRASAVAGSLGNGSLGKGGSHGGAPVQAPSPPLPEGSLKLQSLRAAPAKLLEAPPPQPEPQQPPPPPDLPTDDEDRDAALAAARELVERELGGALAGADADAEEGCALQFERRLLDAIISGAL